MKEVKAGIPMNINPLRDSSAAIATTATNFSGCTACLKMGSEGQ